MKKSSTKKKNPAQSKSPKPKKISSRPRVRRSPELIKFKVTLLGTEPAVWREFILPDSIELEDLHSIIQLVVGWENTHLHIFEIGDEKFGPWDPIDPTDLYQDEAGHLLSDVLEGHSELIYRYDLGDGWTHKVEFTKVKEDKRLLYPICTGGENACPPEDCGGPPGFARLKEVLAGPDSDERDELLSWLGGYYAPKGFDPNFINRQIFWRPLLNDDFEDELDETFF